MKRLLVLLAACGDGIHPVVPPDAEAIPAVIARCATAPSTEMYQDASAFGAVVPGTLAGWDPTGRWFLTGASLNDVSSVQLDVLGDGTVAFDRKQLTGALTADALFERDVQNYNGKQFITARRVANRQPDGSMQMDRAECYDGSCQVCTTKMIRATHNANEGEGDHLSLVGQLLGSDWGPGYTFNVRVAGTIAYLIRQDGLHIIETADPANPVQLGLYRRTHLGYSNDVKLVEANGHRYAVIADYDVDVVDVTDSAHPALVATIKENAHTDFIEQRNGKIYIYFGTYDGTCPIYDLSTPTAPQKLGEFAVNGMLVHDLSVENGIAYLNAWDQGFFVVDYTNPATPVALGNWPKTPTRTSHSNWTTTINGRHIALHGEENYDAKLDLVDVDPTSPTFMQSFATWQTREYVSIHNLMAFGTKAYFTHYQDGVRILDLSDPTNPKQLAYYNTWDPQAAYTSSDFFEGAVGLDVDMTRHLVFVADSPRGLLILSDATE